MYKKIKPNKTTLRINKAYEGETIEQKVNRIVNNKEPITDNAPISYGERKDGVKAECNIRTDRFEVAIDAMDIAAKSHKAKREARIIEMQKKKDQKPNTGTEGQSGDQSQ